MPNRGIGSSNSFVAFNTMRALGPLWDERVIYWILMEYKL
jgi:hypothetical protein